jgi:four helix bundle protein
MRKYENGFRRLIAWQEAKKLAAKIFALTAKFPDSERFHLVDQLRRAAGSIMANLAEGSAMLTRPHRVKFYGTARGSAVEVDNHIELCAVLKYVTQSEHEDIADHCARLTYLITQLMDCR